MIGNAIIHRLRAQIENFYRVENVLTLGSALNVLVPGSASREASERCSRYLLVECVAKSVGLDCLLLLRKVATELGLESIEQLYLPSYALIQRTGFDIEELRERFILPQRDPTRPGKLCLVVADPASLDIQAFNQRGVRVFLGLGSTIERIWSEFSDLLSASANTRLSKEQVRVALLKLTVDARNLGAKEVFLGHPQNDSYEFINAQGRYAGRIHPLLFPAILKLFKDTQRYEFSLEEEGIDKISLSRTKNFDKPVIYLAWTDLTPRSTDITDPVAKPVAPSVDLKISLHSNQILIVDDDPQFLSILQHVLERRGFATILAQSGEEALLKLSECDKKPALVVSDLHMPRADGATLLGQIHHAYPSIPVLVLTSDEDEGTEAEVVMKGAAAYVRKQEDVRILLAWISNLISRPFQNDARVGVA